MIHARICVFRKAEYELQMGPAQTHLRRLATSGGKGGLLKSGGWQVGHRHEPVGGQEPSEVNVLPSGEYKKVWLAISPSGELALSGHHSQWDNVAYLGSCLHVHLGSRRASFLLSSPWLPAEIASLGSLVEVQEWTRYQPTILLCSHISKH